MESFRCSRKTIFNTKPNSGYDDESDWIIYREPQRNGGRRAYTALAKVLRVEVDPVRANHAHYGPTMLTPS